MGNLWMRLFPALWMRWAISVVVAVAAVIALVAFVDHNNNNSEAKGSAKSLAREDQEAQVIVGADQVPRTAKLAPKESLEHAFVAAVRRDMTHRIKTGNVDGKLQKVGCKRSGSQPGRIAYSCVAEAGNVKYPFLGVFTTADKRITYCKRDLPPIPSENIPVSARCRLST
jgi:hypothetical protein